MKCCVIGCGASGIIAARHLAKARIHFDVFEMTDDIGGTWIYTEKDKDTYGTPVHTAMYKNLRTNLPKEIMEFEGFKYNSDKSFITSSDVYQYLKDFVKFHKLQENIQLGKIVLNVAKTQEGWNVSIKDLEKNNVSTFQYDAVMVCNGHHFKPRYPNIEGREVYEGFQIHAKFYKIPEIFKNKNVLVIGFGPSGQDISDDASKEAKTVFLSHHAKNFKAEFFKQNVISKPDVKRLNRDSVTFVDNSTEKIDAILYCTGYIYSYPFLDESCGITVEDNYVRPLYKQFISIKYPTMSFIGLTFKSFLIPLFEIQVKAFIRILQGHKQLPQQSKMLDELQKFEEEKIKLGLPKRKYHQLENIKEYINEVALTGDVEDLPQVIYDIYDHNYEKRYNSLVQYRKYVYKIINENEFTVQMVNK